MKIQQHTDLQVYKKAFEVAMAIFEATKKFPKEETYSLTDQIRRSSRSVCANLAEAWRKPRYKAAFVSKLPMLKAKPSNSGLARICSLVPLLGARARALFCFKRMTRSSECSLP